MMIETNQTHPKGDDVPDETVSQMQAFFAEYAADAAKPHAGEHFKLFVHTLLQRAQAAGLYQP